ncbi:hypothetical protein C2W62_45105, partial [Candidatus Entotheonella serta]
MILWIIATGFVESYITNSSHFLSFWDPDSEDVGGIVSDQIPDLSMGVGLQLFLLLFLQGFSRQRIGAASVRLQVG